MCLIGCRANAEEIPAPISESSGFTPISTSSAIIAVIMAKKGKQTLNEPPKLLYSLSEHA